MKRKSVAAFVRGLEILAPHFENGMETCYFMGGEHDIIHIYVETSTIPEDSEEGKELDELGFHVDEHDQWAWWT